MRQSQWTPAPPVGTAAELRADGLAPSHALFWTVPRVQRQHVEEVDVVVRHEERVAVEEPVLELPRQEVPLRLVRRDDFGVVVAEVVVDTCADEEVRNDGVALRRLVPKPPHALVDFDIVRNLVVQKQVKIPLHHVPRIGELLVDGVVPDARPALVVLAVADVEDIVRGVPSGRRASGSTISSGRNPANTTRFSASRSTNTRSSVLPSISMSSSSTRGRMRTHRPFRSL